MGSDRALCHCLYTSNNKVKSYGSRRQWRTHTSYCVSREPGTVRPSSPRTIRCIGPLSNVDMDMHVSPFMLSQEHLSDWQIPSFPVRLSLNISFLLRLRVCLCLCVCTRVYLCARACVCVCVCVCAHARAQVHMCRYVCVFITWTFCGQNVLPLSLLLCISCLKMNPTSYTENPSWLPF